MDLGHCPFRTICASSGLVRPMRFPSFHAVATPAAVRVMRHLVLLLFFHRRLPRVDGDALMFSRDLVIEGDVEAVLALRNAIDDAQLDLVTELSAVFGPLGAPARRALEMAHTHFSRRRALWGSHI